jgi:hypothetical protein
VRFWRLVIAVGLAAGFALGPGAVSAVAVVIVNATNVSVPSVPATQDGRFAPDNAPSQCGGLDFAPTRTDQGTAFQFTNHTFRSRLTNPICVTASLTTACTGANSIFSVAYIGTFNPADPLAGYAADIGTVGSGTRSYSFAPPGGSFFSIVVHEVSSGAGCSSYNLNVSSDGPWADSSPAIVGNAPATGATITGNNAGWATNPAAPVVERRWLRCDAVGAGCSEIPGATGATYTVTDVDVGHTLRFRNVATDADGTSTADSAFVEPFIPFETHAAESLGPGDRVHAGIFVRNTVESRCSAPTPVPTILQPANNFLYDVFSVGSLLNEPVCLVARTLPACGSGVSPAIYDPVFAPTSGIAANYAANSGAPFSSAATASNILPPAGAREITVSVGFSAGDCPAYSLILGADAPFASARPTVDGAAVEGGTLTATAGSWSGTPAISHSWLSCDANGDGCTPIPGASGASYAPTSADVGRRVRARVTATQGRSVSSDSEPTTVITAAPTDRTPPAGSVRLGSRNLRRAVRTGNVLVDVTANELCSAVVQLTVARGVARRLGLKRRLIGRARGSVRAEAAGTRRAVAAATRLRARLTRRARRALRGRAGVRLRITATLTDAAGNNARATRAVSLKRPRRR